jgi:broad specificity phosphatase PhoE
MIEQLILVRHGQTVSNVAGIAQGWNDSALSERGSMQVARVASRLARVGVDAVFSSPLQRALSTAQAIADASAKTVTTLDDLREMNYGDWEGRSFHEVRRDDAETYRGWVDDPDRPSPNGESHNAVLERIRRALDVVTRFEGEGERVKRVVAVSHGTAIRIAATVLLGVPLSAARLFAQDNASVNIFVWRSDRYVLKLWNDTSHCGDENEERGMRNEA